MSTKVERIEHRLRLKTAKRLKIDKLPRWVHLVGLGGTLVVLAVFIVLFLVFKDVSVWEGWLVADEFINPEYGEQIFVESIFRTRMNTWSNLSYISFGFYAIALSINDWNKSLRLERGYLSHVPVFSFLFGLGAIYSGLGSGFFHASLTRYGQQCDVGAMYAMMLCMAAIPLGSCLPRIEVPGTRQSFRSWPLLSILVVLGSLYFTYYKWDYEYREISPYFSGVLFLFAAFSLVQPGKYLQMRWFIAAIVSILVAAKIRELDIQGNFTSPDSLLQGHALWHLLSCLFYVFIFLYFRSEEREK